ncbi:MAG: hypothetical protein AAGA03_18240, partial [Planctomycetota bacterium]
MTLSLGQPGDWGLDASLDSLPLSVLQLLQRWKPEWTASLPRSLDGDISGGVAIRSSTTDGIRISLQQLAARGLQATDPKRPSQVWRNQLTSMNGDLTWLGDRVLGRNLLVATDFATGTFNGQVASSISLVGEGDNPFAWLDKIDGTATAEIDLAALDRSLPGLIPLRSDAQLRSGRVSAQLESLAGVPRRSRLSLRTNAINGQSRGRTVTLQPIDLTATVANRQGQITAEQFEFRSSFGQASGRGNARAGNADIKLDFGRLTAAIRPLVSLPGTTLEGGIDGRIQWEVAAGGRWTLGGVGTANNLLVQIPGGTAFKSRQWEADVSAVGVWSNSGASGGTQIQAASDLGRLAQLVRAEVNLKNQDVGLQATLAQPVEAPTLDTLLPIRLQGNGNVAAIGKLLPSFIPSEISQMDGTFTLDTNLMVSRTNANVSKLSCGMINPSVTYSGHRLEQPKLQLEFAGRAAFPENDLSIQKLTLQGDAVTASVRGDIHSGTADLEIAWRADLKSLQQSVSSQIANRPTAFRPASFGNFSGPKPPGSSPDDIWQIHGRCEGNFVVKSNGDLVAIQTNASGNNLAVIQPVSQSRAIQSVGPQPRSATAGATRLTNQSDGRMVWWEPTLEVDGAVNYDLASGKLLAKEVEIRGDWMIAQLTGHMKWDAQDGEVSLSGPGRFLMDHVGQRLTQLTGMNIEATGVHQTPLSINAVRGPGVTVALAVMGDMGWELARPAGVPLGTASIPIPMPQTTVTVTPA